MSVYADAASGYRDTTKWLTALVPVTASGLGPVGLTRWPSTRGRRARVPPTFGTSSPTTSWRSW